MRNHQSFLPYTTTGFTLFELIITITIVSIITLIAISYLDRSREGARNEAVITQMHEYQKSLELYYADTGEYPSPTTNNEVVCLSNESQANCIASGDAAPVMMAMSEYQSFFPYFNQGAHGGPAYSGCDGSGGLSDNTACDNNQSYSIFFTLEGEGANCGGRAAAVSDASISSRFTLCRLGPPKLTQ